MGEYQNRAVALMTACLGEKIVSDPKERRESYLETAVALFYALGGTREEFARAGMVDTNLPVDAAIGDVMKELAAIGTLHDLDIMQAAYNTLDQQTQSVRQTVGAVRKRR